MCVLTMIEEERRKRRVEGCEEGYIQCNSVGTLSVT